MSFVGYFALSASYGSSMSSPAQSLVFHTFEGLKDWNDKIQTHVHDILQSLDSGYGLVDENEEAELCLLGLNQKVKVEGIEEEEMTDE